MPYVSITGLRVKSALHLPRFWWLTLRAAGQARRAEGNLRVELRQIAGTYHTLTVWQDQAAMRRYLTAGAHLKAMRAFRALGSGRTYGYEADSVPEWEEAYALWQERSRPV
jgi:heme-degrading monooxygenase HmoA